MAYSMNICGIITYYIQRGFLDVRLETGRLDRNFAAVMTGSERVDVDQPHMARRGQRHLCMIDKHKIYDSITRKTHDE